MASSVPETVVNNEDEEFENAFKEFAGEKPPAPEPEPVLPSEGNAPVDEGSADEVPPDPAETGTSDQLASAPVVPAGEAPDPWANYPDDVRAQLAQLQKERDEAQYRAKSDANRVAALSRKLSEFTNGSARSVQPQENKPEQTEAQKALDAKIAQFKEDYSDVADPVISLLEAQKEELNSVRAVVGQLNEERQAAQVAAERQALEARHPDWQQIAGDPKFGSWLEVQPPAIQGLASSWDSRETSVALSLFKSEMGMAASQGEASGQPAAAATDARRSQQLDGGRQIRSKPAPAASGAPDDYDAAFAHYQRIQDAKLSSNRR